MKTIIENNDRVFIVHRNGFFTRDYFTNLEDIPNIITQELEKNDEYIILEYWNKKFKRVSKKNLNAMFTANNINFKI
tara:strand:- start:621 stop:851 length:231 start_codon:yes stop_codon:yes gene_type:complete